MLLAKNIEAVDLAVFLKKQRTLVFGDLHLGYEGNLNKKGIFIPRFAMQDLQSRLELILKKTRPEKIIINGDVKHEFGRISDDEWRWTLRILDLLKKVSQRLVIIKGNHDLVIGPIAEKRNVEMMNHIILDDTLILHGDVFDKKFFKDHPKIKTVIIGHEHPAISLSDNGRSEKFKCFLVGTIKIGVRKMCLIVTPSVQQFTDGTDIVREERLSPFLQGNLNNFNCYVVGKNEILRFGKLKNLK